MTFYPLSVIIDDKSRVITVFIHQNRAIYIRIKQACANDTKEVRDQLIQGIEDSMFHSAGVQNKNSLFVPSEDH